MADAIVTIAADLSAARREIAKLPDMVGSEARTAMIKLESAVVQAEKAAKRATKSVAKQAKAQAREQERAFNDIKRASSAVFGDVVNKVDDVATGLGAIGPVGAVAVATLLTFAGTVAGIAAAGAAVYSVVDGAADLVEELQEAGQATYVSEAQLAQLRAAQDAIDGVSTAFSELGVQLALEMSPAVEHVAEALIGLLVVMRDSGDVAKQVFANFARQFPTLAGLTAAFGTAAGVGGDLTDELADLGREYVSNAALTEEAMLAALGFTVSEEELAAASRETADALKREAQASRELEAQREAAHAAEAARLRAIKALRDQAYNERIDNIDAMVTAINAELDVVIASAEQQIANARMIADAWIATTQDVAGSMTSIGDTIAGLKEQQARTAIETAEALAESGSDQAEAAAQVAEEAKASAVTAFNISKGLAAAQIGIDTAAAVTKAIAMYGPPPSPAGIAGIAAATATGAASLASVLAQPAPQFHMGGVIAPDERMITARPGEGVLTARGVSALGGEAGIAAANRGETGGAITIVQQVRHRIMDTVTAENMRNPLSATSLAVRGGDRVGHSGR